MCALDYRERERARERKRGKSERIVRDLQGVSEGAYMCWPGELARPLPALTSLPLGFQSEL